jgi:hypothetical protein
MHRKVIPASLAILLLAGSIVAVSGMTADEFEQLVLQDLRENGSEHDSIIEVLQVIGIGPEQRDMFAAGIINHGKLVAIYFDDSKRSDVKAVTAEVTITEVKPQLLSRAGLQDFIEEHEMPPGDAYLVAPGPFSFFGSTGIGWYVKTADSFYLISLLGMRLPAEMAQKFTKAFQNDSWLNDIPTEAEAKSGSEPVETDAEDKN